MHVVAFVEGLRFVPENKNAKDETVIQKGSSPFASQWPNDAAGFFAMDDRRRPKTLMGFMV